MAGDLVDSTVEKVRSGLAAIGWRIVRANINTDTGFARLILHRDGERENEVVRLTVLRPGWDARTVVSRDVGFICDGFFPGKWLNVIDGFHMGTTRHEGIRDALRFVGGYVADNAGVPRVTGKNAVRALAGLFAQIAEDRR